MSETATTSKIGSAEWWEKSADKVLTTALDIVKGKLLGVGDTGDAANTSNSASTTQSALMDKLPFVLGAAALVGIGVILWKR